MAAFFSNTLTLIFSQILEIFYVFCLSFFLSNCSLKSLFLGLDEPGPRRGEDPRGLLHLPGHDRQTGLNCSTSQRTSYLFYCSGMWSTALLLNGQATSFIAQVCGQLLYFSTDKLPLSLLRYVTGVYIFPKKYILPPPLSKIIFFPPSRYCIDWAKIYLFSPLEL